MKALISVVGVLLIFLTSYELAGAQRGPWEASLHRCEHVYHSRGEGESRYVKASSYAVQAIKQAGQISNKRERSAAYAAIRPHMAHLADSFAYLKQWGWAEYDWRWVLELDRNSIDCRSVTATRDFMAEAYVLQNLAKCCKQQGKAAEAEQFHEQEMLLRNQPTRETEISLRNWKPGQGHALAQARSAAARRYFVPGFHRRDERLPEESQICMLFQKNHLSMDELKVFSVDDLGGRIGVNCKQYIHELEVIDFDNPLPLTFVFDYGGMLVNKDDPDTQPRPPANVNTAPKVTREQANAIFRKQKLDPKYKDFVLEPIQENLVVIKSSGVMLHRAAPRYVLAWAFRMPSPNDLHPLLFVDAQSGQPVWSEKYLIDEARINQSMGLFARNHLGLAGPRIVSCSAGPEPYCFTLEVHQRIGNVESFYPIPLTFERNGTLSKWGKVVIPRFKGSTVPKISADAARKIFLNRNANYPGASAVTHSEVQQPKLGLYARDRSPLYCLAWELRSSGGYPHMYVDARNGEELFFDDGIRY